MFWIGFLSHTKHIYYEIGSVLEPLSMILIFPCLFQNKFRETPMIFTLWSTVLSMFDASIPQDLLRQSNVLYSIGPPETLALADSLR